MGFKADYQSIENFAERLDKLSGEALSAAEYAGEWLDIGYSDGRMFVTVAGAASDAKEALQTNYKRLREIQKFAAGEVDRAARFYHINDRAQAERLDETYE